MIKAIIFDWGGVLIDDPAKGLMNYCAKELNVEYSLLKETFSQYEPKFTKGIISEKDLWKNICEDLDIDKTTSKSLWGEAVNHVFSDKQEMFNLMKILKQNGYKIGFLSNTEIPTTKYFFDNEYEKYFDEMAFSCIEKTMKPEKEIYQIILSKLQVQASESIFIDDKPKNVEGAIQLGIHGIIFKSINQLNQELNKFQVKIKKNT